MGSVANVFHLTKAAFLLVFGFTVRMLLMSSSYQKMIADRVEISTPVNSWKRVVEGVTLMKHNISPYEGDTFHEVPLFLQFYNFLIVNCDQWIPVIFTLVDLVTAIFLSLSSYLQLKTIRKWEKIKLKKLKKTDSEALEIPEKIIGDISFRIFTIYLLLPYSILPCVAKSTSVFTNFLMSLIMLTVSLGFRSAACLLVALVAYHSLYPILLVFPVLMALEKTNSNGKSFSYSSKGTIFSLAACFISTLLLISIFVMVSESIAGSFAYLSSSYLFLLSVPDFTPNIGLFWYFFTEMFDQFRDFFLWTFQINTFVYSIPLSLTLKENPNFFFLVTLILLSLFKPYPSISDLSIYLALLPQWTHLFTYMKQGLLVACVFISCTVLAPLMWQMWIILGTANSNFYFGVTLAYNVGQIFLITDLLFAYLKRDFYLSNGIKLDEQKKPLKLELSAE
ncbi:phosphatidylinositol glycan anchor biosynthesis class U protein-like [Panonychus citri]|uniref:phosphatidylinositol glycan anchor biosynthesis class U protein-like n=1 Tax=Panonychus citri TaxID=50023 RepID=UPI0023070849|nr:phosphatidylinositol glycan anchor biosynthesis class U protein-like [Panonychus citri]